MNRSTSWFALTLAALATAASARAAEPLDETIATITHRWAAVTYQTPPARQDAGYQELIATTEAAVATYPGRAEPLVWQAIALSSAAKVEGGLSALSKVKRARELLFEAEKIDPNTLSGSIYGSLGSLYAKVPGWPVGFGSKSKATEYLKHALAINPQGIDPNYFYADLLADEGQYAEARDYARRALAAPPRPGREDSDAGRRTEAQALLDRIQQKSPQ